MYRKRNNIHRKFVIGTNVTAIFRHTISQLKFGENYPQSFGNCVVFKANKTMEIMMTATTTTMMMMMTVPH